MAENSGKTAARGRPFQKGQSGNPGGRPKISAEFKDKCRVFTDSTVLPAWQQEISERGEHWVKCAELIAAYGHGKPTQAVTGDDGGPLEVIVNMVTDES